ncbi:MAG: response regulator [Methylococcales bacterium]|jgi:DNA-binding response OmpR family regulator|nr:response regulator [Methylococcales bacterium]
MSKKILITDDEPHIRLLLEQALEDLEDYDVEFFFAENGEIALDIIREEKPGLVLLDVMMPKMNGFDVCKTVKRDWEMSDVYIIMLTAKGQEYDKDKGLDVGADLYMTKPFNPDEIMAHAIRVLEIELD